MTEINTVEDYYSYGSQGNSFAPNFDDLADSSKKYWMDVFIEYKSKQAELNKVK